MKNERKGVTMVSLLAIITVLIILAGVGATIGVNSMKQADDTQKYSELLMVQHAVLEQYTKFQTTKDTSYLVGEKITLSSAQTTANNLGVTLVTIPDNYSNKDYYKLDKTALEKIGVTNTDDEFIINYISGEVLNLTTKKAGDGSALYITANSFND